MCQQLNNLIGDEEFTEKDVWGRLIRWQRWGTEYYRSLEADICGLWEPGVRRPVSRLQFDAARERVRGLK